MRLISLNLKNFKGIRDIAIMPNGQNIDIFGDNATGKTTISDAYHWLLTGKDSQGKKDFEIKTLDKNNQPIHNLEHEVEGVFDLDGRTLTLRKVLSEKWTKKRGSITQEFTGHQTDYFINGVPAKESEYVAKINEFAKEEYLKLLSNPLYFNTQLHWTDRRKTVITACGNVNDDEVIASTSTLSRLPEALQGRSVDDHKKVIAARRAKINDELQTIPVRISEAKQSIPELSPDWGSADELSSHLEKLNAYLAEKNRELSAVQNGGAVSEKRVELAKCDAEILRIKNEANAKANEQRGEVQEKYYAAKGRVSSLRSDVDSYKPKLLRLKADLFALEQSTEGLRKQWHEVNGEALELNIESVCPTCGQSLPEEQVSAAREKATADFNRSKSERLERINQTGQKNKEDSERIRRDIADTETRIKDLDAQLAVAEADAAKFLAEMNTFQPVIDSASTREVESKKEKILQEITDLQSGSANSAQAIRDEIAVVNENISTIRGELAKIEVSERQNKRIAELEQQEKDLAREYEKLEGELYLTEEFIRAKVAMLEQKINSKFKMARFKLFNQQINGGIEPCCETTFEGVPYSDLNNAARINVGLDIINTLSDFFGLKAPIFIDNRESITKLIDVDSQIISLIVSERDKKLRAETPGKEMKEAV